VVILSVAIVIIVILLIISFISWLQEGGWMLLLALTAVAIVVGLLYIASKKLEKRRLEQELLEQERQKKLEFLNAPEPAPKLISLPEAGEYANAEEKRINQLFRQFLEAENDGIRVKNRLNWLAQKQNIYISLSLTGKEG